MPSIQCSNTSPHDMHPMDFMSVGLCPGVKDLQWFLDNSPECDDLPTEPGEWSKRSVEAHQKKREEERVEELTREAGKALFDRAAKKHYGISGDQWLWLYDRDMLAECCEYDHMYMLIPFAREV